MAWIKMRTDLARDPAVIQLADRYGWEEHVIVGLLHKLWSWADEQVTNGNAPGVTRSFIDRYLGVTGFSDNLEKVGWLSENTDGIVFPHWERHMGQSAKTRAVTALRVGKHRCNAPTVTKTLPDKIRVREEKIREESKEEASASVISKGNDDHTGIPSAQEFFDRWNAFARSKPALKSATKFTAERRKKIITRLKDVDWWVSFLAAVQLLPLGGDGWQPDLNWIVNNGENVYLILEGKYDWRSDNQSSRKLRERREKVAADYREARLQEHKAKCKQDARGTNKAISDILSPTNGKPGEQKEVSLLFGSEDDSSASGA